MNAIVSNWTPNQTFVRCCSVYCEAVQVRIKRLWRSAESKDCRTVDSALKVHLPCNSREYDTTVSPETVLATKDILMTTSMRLLTIRFALTGVDVIYFFHD